MSGLQDFLTPFSHLVFANRDKVIVLLGVLLAWFTIQLLVTRWRNERLERDLAAAKTTPSASGGRRYAANTQAEEPPAETGAFPPIKGGRTYARNLGTALQKAGIAGPQIYSPPSPPGWAPNTNPLQPGASQPGPGAPYAPQNVPWAAPAGPPASPWGYPSSPGRGMPGAAPAGGPFYQPQPPPQQPQSPPAGPPPGPGFYGPPAGMPFGQPAFPAMTSGPAAPAPTFVPPAPSDAPAMPPAFGSNPPPQGPDESTPADATRRGKPKRRRFNFNVLENLEKMVQPRAAEPAPSTGWAPPASSMPQAAPGLAMPSTPETSAIPQPTPVADTATPTKQAPAEADILPLRFGPEVEAEPVAVEPEPEAVQSEADAVQPEEAVEKSERTGGKSQPGAVVEAEVEAPMEELASQSQAAPEAERDEKPSMRSMLFGEEAMPEREAEPAGSEREPAVAAQAEPETTPDLESTPEPQPVTQGAESDPWRPWQPALDSEPDAELARRATDEAPAASGPETPEVGAADGPSAGTVVIIEDDQTAASYYATLFRGNGYQVEVATDGVSGVDLCTRMQPQLILLDVMMPRQNGILVLQTLRASDETKNTPVVVMSNFSEPTLIKRAIQLGALEYVIKTQVEGPALLSALPRWINHEKAFAAV